ncbi:MAG TPA: type II toxin-antitoxin system RelE/ParE family toxin [Rhizomicrobium sp.]|jgi:plasmid stabilization system protein ParE
MPELRIIVSTEARADLLALEQYITEHDGPMRAELILSRIEGVVRTLAFMPGLGRPRAFLERGTRAFPIAPWLIVYALLPKRDGIRVIRILDGRRDLARILGRRRRVPRKRQQQR